MKALHLMFFLLLVGWASCTCNLEEGKRYRMVDDCPINRMYRPLCGTDGCSYINDDALACAQKTDPKLKIAYDGECGSRDHFGGEEPEVMDDENEVLN